MTELNMSTLKELSSHPMLRVVFVKKQYLLDFEGGYGEYEKGTVVCVNSYPGLELSFDVLLCDGSIYCNLPIWALASEPQSCDSTMLHMKKVKCPSSEFVTYVIPNLKYLSVFDNDKKFTCNAAYICSIEWHEDNELVHLAINDEGGYLYAPNHKVLAGANKKELPKWKKQRL